MNNIYEHLEKPKGIVRTLFLDFSSAFNTIKPSILIDRLNELNVNANIVSWIFQFLTNRTQYVKFQNFVSGSITTNTGSPQGCVLSPVLFTIYTNICQINNDIVKLLKFADDSCIQGLIAKDSWCAWLLRCHKGDNAEVDICIFRLYLVEICFK